MKCNITTRRDKLRSIMPNIVIIIMALAFAAVSAITVFGVCQSMRSTSYTSCYECSGHTHDCEFR